MPVNVERYLDAQWWMAIHWGLPMFGILLVAAIVVIAVRAYRDRQDEKDEGFTASAGKTLGL